MNIQEIPIDRIKEQTLTRPFNSQAIHELAASIKQHGILENLIVATDENGIHLIAGQRRLAAAKLIGLATVPCNVLDADHETALGISLHENLQRENLSVFDESQMYRYLVHKLHYSNRDIARMIGKSEPYVSQRLRIHAWPADLQEALRANQLDFSICRELAEIDDPAHLKECLRQAVEFGVNYRTARAWRINYKKAKALTPQDSKPSVELPTPSSPVPVMIDCFGCELHYPQSEIVTVYLCKRCFDILQDTIRQAKESTLP